MDTETKNKIEYFIALINEFAKRHHLNDEQAFRYLDKYDGIDMIDEHYGIVHTLSFADVVDALTLYCNRNGGNIPCGSTTVQPSTSGR